LQAIARYFPSEFAGTIFVVAHIGQSRSTLPDLLRKAGNLSASHPREEEPIRGGPIYVAPPDRHLLIEDGKVRLSRGPRKHLPGRLPIHCSAPLPPLPGVALSASC